MDAEALGPLDPALLYDRKTGTMYRKQELSYIETACPWRGPVPIFHGCYPKGRLKPAQPTFHAALQSGSPSVSPLRDRVYQLLWSLHHSKVPGG